LKTIKQYQEAGLLLSEVRSILNQPEKTIEILLGVQKRLFEQKQMLEEQMLLLKELIEEKKRSQ
jgi:DNA-binding transcriptional MerR regulator